jgi:acetyltransferase-like isoleucine patch superfamily enzyme
VWRNIQKHIVTELINRLFLTIIFPFMAVPILRLLRASIGTNCRIYTPLVFQNSGFGKLTVGNNCHIGRGVFLDLSDRISIGNNVTISMNVTLITHIDVGDSPLKKKGFPAKTGQIFIEDGAYVGAGATILHGVRIGTNTLVAAGTLVNKDVPSNCLVAGIPAKTIRIMG